MRRAQRTRGPFRPAILLLLAAIATGDGQSQAQSVGGDARGRLGTDDFDRQALERIVSGSDDDERGELRRQALIARQLDLNAYLPWRSGIGPGSYYWGAPYWGPPYPGITASYSAGAFYGHAYGVPRRASALSPATAVPPSIGHPPTSATSEVGQSTDRSASRVAADWQASGFVAADSDRATAPPLLSTALYGAYGIGRTGVGASVNPLFAGLPGWLNAFEPTPYVPGWIFGYPYVGAVEQPLGHRILSAGAKGYIYEPVYARNLLEHAVAASSLSEPAAFPQSSPPPAIASGESELTAEGRRSLADALAAFQRQNYQRALKALDLASPAAEPYLPAELLRAQALMAIGEIEAASEALHKALAGLPERQWGTIVENYREYYLLDAPFGGQLRRLEKYTAAHPDSAGAAFVLGYEYGFLGYPAEAAEQLERGVKLAPHDPLMAKLAARFRALANRQGAGQTADEPAKPVPEELRAGPREL